MLIIHSVWSIRDYLLGLTSAVHGVCQWHFRACVSVHTSTDGFRLHRVRDIVI